MVASTLSISKLIAGCFLVFLLHPLQILTEQSEETRIENIEKQETRISPNIINLFIKLDGLKSYIVDIFSKVNSLERQVMNINAHLELKEEPGHDCCEILKRGFRVSQSYIKIGEGLVKVRCDMETDGGGWTVIQRRTLDGIGINFTRNFEDYVNGFGSVPDSYWIGLKNIAILTQGKDQEIRFDMEAFNPSKGKAFAKYGQFFVSGPKDKYRLTIGDYSGTAGDSMDYHDGLQFTTIDKDIDKNNMGNCAQINKSGWWYRNCHQAHPNGIQYSTETNNFNSLSWGDFDGSNSLKFMEMKIRNKNQVLCGIN